MEVVTVVPNVAEGHELTLSYSKTDVGYTLRHAWLLEHYHFSCECARCVHEQTT